MPPDLTPRSPGWWLLRLVAKLEARRSKVRLYDEYYDGEHKLAFASAQFEEAFGGLFAEFADNWCEVVVDAPVERLRVEGFRFGAAGEDADDDAWRIWQANGLDLGSDIAHTEAIKHGESYVLVGPGGDVPEITIEHASEFIVETAPGGVRRVAALKHWVEIDGSERANVYLPAAVHKFARRGGGIADSALWVPSDAVLTGGWEQIDEISNPLGVVPGIPLLNKPTVRRVGRSDLRSVIPLQDGINKLVTDMFVASEYSALPQRWATGLELPVNPLTGKPDNTAFEAARSRLWAVGNGEVKFGQFEPEDLKNLAAGVEMLVQHLAAQTRTPPHYLIGQIVNASGDALKAAETGLVAKTRKKMIPFGEAWEEAMRLAFKLIGEDARASATDAETLWADPESRTTGEQVDAGLKEKALGIPDEAIWTRRLGASPQEVKRWRQLRAEAALQIDLLAFDPAAQGVPPQPAPVNGAGG